MIGQEKGVAMQYEARICPDCGAARVQTEWSTDRFPYGEGPTAVELSAEVPFRKCAECGFEYTDSDAEEIRSAAIRQHLKVMLPADIVELRDGYEMTRAEFAARTRIGSASLARWESGSLIQSAAYDNYLYLLRFRDNMARLEGRFSPSSPQLRADITVPAASAFAALPRCRQARDPQAIESRARLFLIRRPMKQRAG